jgi:hypothetical protein
MAENVQRSHAGTGTGTRMKSLPTQTARGDIAGDIAIGMTNGRRIEMEAKIGSVSETGNLIAIATEIEGEITTLPTIAPKKTAYGELLKMGDRAIKAAAVEKTEMRSIALDDNPCSCWRWETGDENMYLIVLLVLWNLARTLCKT